MQKLRVESFTISIDGFGAGTDQDLDNPMGIGGGALHKWAFTTHTFKEMFGQSGGALGVDNDFAVRGFSNIGAWIMGRNMFGPVRGPWPDESWKGWWGDNPPYHVPVFVFTHHKRSPLEMTGHNLFYFTDKDIHTVLEQAFEAADGKDVRLGGGINVIRQYLQAGLIDEMHIAISPVILGAGEHLFSDLDLRSLGYDCSKHVATENATHCIITKIKS